MSKINKTWRCKRVLAIGGPWDGQTIAVGAAGTLVFSLDHYTGHYDGQGAWISERKEK